MHTCQETMTVNWKVRVPRTIVSPSARNSNSGGNNDSDAERAHHRRRSAPRGHESSSRLHCGTPPTRHASHLISKDFETPYTRHPCLRDSLSRQRSQPLTHFTPTTLSLFKTVEPPRYGAQPLTHPHTLQATSPSIPRNPSYYGAPPSYVTQVTSPCLRHSCPVIERDRVASLGKKHARDHEHHHREVREVVRYRSIELLFGGRRDNTIRVEGRKQASRFMANANLGVIVTRHLQQYNEETTTSTNQQTRRE